MISVISNSKLQTTVKWPFWSQVARVNFVIGVRFLVDPKQILFLMNMVGLLSYGNCACAKRIPRQQYLWTWRQSVVPNDAPRDFGPEVAFVS